MTCGSCKHEDVRDEVPCTGCSHGRWWTPKDEPVKDDIVKPLKALAFSLHRRADERAADLIDAAVEQICTTRQIAELFLTGPEGQRLVISSELEMQHDNSFRFTVTEPASQRRWGVVAGITELVPNAPGKPTAANEPNEG